MKIFTSDLKVFPLPRKWLNSLKAITRKLWGVDLDDLIGQYHFATCFDMNCLLWSTNRRSRRRRVIYEGFWIGVYHEKRLLPSISLVEKIFANNHFRAAIVVTYKASELFLYGKDVFETSVLTSYEPADSIVAVLEPEEKFVIGFALYDASCKCYRNLYDLSIFLRLLG